MSDGGNKRPSARALKGDVVSDTRGKRTRAALAKSARARLRDRDGDDDEAELEEELDAELEHVETSEHLPNIAPAVRRSALAFSSQSLTAGCERIVIKTQSEPVSILWSKGMLPPQLAAQVLHACAADAAERPRGTRVRYTLEGVREGDTITADAITLAGQVRPSRDGFDRAIGLDLGPMDASPTGQIAAQMKHTERTMQLTMGAWGTVMQEMRRELEAKGERIRELEMQVDAKNEVIADYQKRIAAVANDELALRAATAEIETRAETQRHLSAQLSKYIPVVLSKVLGKLPADAQLPSGDAAEPAPPALVAALKSITPEQLAQVGAHLGDPQRLVIDRCRRDIAVTWAELECFVGFSDEAIAVLGSAPTGEQLMPVIEVMEEWSKRAAKAKASNGAAHVPAS